VSAAQPDLPGTPFIPWRRFVALLASAESAIRAGQLDAEFLSQVRELSDLAIGPLATELAHDLALRQRWDAVFAHSDPELLRLDAAPLSPSFLTLAQARVRARLLIQEAEEYLSSGDELHPALSGFVAELQALEAAHDLPALYDGDWLDRLDAVIFAHKDLGE
jgi:hypothetical protein